MLNGAALDGMRDSYENNGNLSPDRQGGVGRPDCLNRFLTVAARCNIFIPCGVRQAAMAGAPCRPRV